VDDAHTVRHGERTGNFDGDACRNFRRKGALFTQQLPQCHPTHQLDNEVLLNIVGLRNIVDFNDVGMFDLRYRKSLAVKARGYFWILTQVTMDDFERNLAPQSLISSTKYSGHATMPDLLDQLVFGKFNGVLRDQSQVFL